jgi:hypothetical protein
MTSGTRLAKAKVMKLRKTMGWLATFTSLAALSACGDSGTGAGGQAGSPDVGGSGGTSNDGGSSTEGGNGGGATNGGGNEGGGTCEVDPTYMPDIVPADFEDANGNPLPIDNPLYPLIPGTVFEYVEEDDAITITVTSDTKVIMGVTCVVVRDTHKDANDDLVEDTFDWFAQDVDGNVWYFGEDTKEYENGEVSSAEGSWEGGVDGAFPGINMLATPMIGDVYRQEYLACEAEDMATVIDLNASISSPFGDLTGCLQTYDYSAFNPDAHELKYFCPNVGFVSAITLSDGVREELTAITDP